jgi:hypothetical protein
VSWLDFAALTSGIGYVGVDVLANAVVLVLRRDVFVNVVLGRRGAAVLAVAIALLMVLLVAATVEASVRWPALAVFPMLGALWVGADLLPVLQITFGNSESYRTRTVSLLSTFGGLTVFVGLVLTFVRAQVSG